MILKHKHPLRSGNRWKFSVPIKDTKNLEVGRRYPVRIRRTGFDILPMLELKRYKSSKGNWEYFFHIPQAIMDLMSKEQTYLLEVQV